MRLVRAVALLLLALAAPARAWGPEGHAAVGAAAERALTPAAAARVKELLDGARLSDPAVASWADDDAKAGRSPRAFHYVNVPVGAARYEPARDCKRGRCVVAKLEAEIAALGDAQLPRARRAEALRWVVHLVGDAHQPLHCADRGDRGGNDTPVFSAGHETNLHAFWDHLPKRCPLSGAPRAPPFTVGEDPRAWPRAWIDECHAIARGVYAEALEQEGRHGLRLGRRYVARQCGLVDGQLARAGARLAAVLNATLR